MKEGIYEGRNIRRKEYMKEGTEGLKVGRNIEEGNQKI